jgi:hypothetical protein
MNINYLEELIHIRELKNYIKVNFNIDTTIRIPADYCTNIKIETYYLKLLIYIIILIIYIYILYKIIKYNEKYIFIVDLVLFIILFYLVINIFQNIYIIYLYYNYYKKKLNDCIYYKNIVYETGDIIQEYTPWYSKMGILINIFDIKNHYFHSGIIINFNNKIYILQIMNNKFKYSNYALDFDNCKHLEICPLDSYIMDNTYCTKYYRLFKNSNKDKINNYMLFSALSRMNIEKIIFNYGLTIVENDDYDKNFSVYYNCVNFIYKLLYKLDIIPLFNFQNVLSNDLLFLPKLSNNIYQKEIFIKN